MSRISATNDQTLCCKLLVAACLTFGTVEGDETHSSIRDGFGGGVLKTCIIVVSRVCFDLKLYAYTSYYCSER